MIALVLLTRSQLRVDPIQPCSRTSPSEVSDPIVTIDTSKMTLALEEGSKKTTSASKVLSVLIDRLSIDRLPPVLSTCSIILASFSPTQSIR